MVITGGLWHRPNRPWPRAPLIWGAPRIIRFPAKFFKRGLIFLEIDSISCQARMFILGQYRISVAEFTLRNMGVVVIYNLLVRLLPPTGRCQ